MAIDASNTPDIAPRKPYVQPRLESYGDLATVTQGFPRVGMNDSGSGAKTTT